MGKDFDAVWLRPDPSSSLGINLRHAADATDALARVFALSAPADVAGVWLRGERAPAITSTNRDPRAVGSAPPKSLAAELVPSPSGALYETLYFKP